MDNEKKTKLELHLSSGLWVVRTENELIFVDAYLHLRVVKEAFARIGLTKDVMGGIHLASGRSLGSPMEVRADGRR